MCKVLCVSASGFYNYLSRKPCKAQQRRRKIAFQIHMVHHEYRQTYGSPRVCVALNMRGIKCSENYVAKLMQQEGIRPKSAKKFRVRTTDSNHALKVAPNILQRNFTQSEPNKAWAGDITYIRTKEGFIYLAVVLDLYSRQVVGMEHATPYAEQLGDGCAKDGLVQTTTRTWIHLPLGSRQSVLQSRISEYTG